MKTPIFNISSEMLNLIAEIESARSTVKGCTLMPEREIEVRQRATVENIHSSTSIEGNRLSENQVAAVLSNKTPISRDRYAELEVRNYEKALKFIDKRSMDATPISVADILEIHRILMDGLLPPSKVGSFREGDIYIVDQRDTVVYTGVPASEILGELTSLLTWVSETDLHPCIVAGILHLYFVSVHPFADGNGRTTRILTLLHLGLSGYDFRGALVLDSFYADDKRRYYDELSKAHGEHYQDFTSEQIEAWLNYFLEGFVSSAKILEATVRILAISVNPLSKVRKLPLDDVDILSYVSQFGSINIAEAEEILSHLSRRSVQRKLQHLVDEGYLKTENGGRSTFYIAD